MTGVFDDPGKQSSERLLVSEACRKTNSHNPAGAACRGQVPTPIRQEYPPRATEKVVYSAYAHRCADLSIKEV
jgi:hypothetical protein